MQRTLHETSSDGASLLCLGSLPPVGGGHSRTSCSLSTQQGWGIHHPTPVLPRLEESPAPPCLTCLALLCTPRHHPMSPDGQDRALQGDSAGCGLFFSIALGWWALKPPHGPPLPWRPRASLGGRSCFQEAQALRVPRAV